MPDRILLPLIVACALFMENLDSTVLSTALVTIARDFGVSPIPLKLALTSYLLSLAVFIPVSGWVADRFGARNVFRLAIAVFLLGSILSGMATGLPSLVFGRVVQGAGGAMMVPVGRLVILRSVEKSQLVGALAWLTAPALIGPVMGPPVGGFIATYFDWRWIFWINVPIGLLGLVLATLHIPDIRGERQPFDLIGFVLLGVGLATLVSSGTLLGLDAASPLAIGLLAATGAALLAAYAVHARRTAHPIVDPALFRLDTFRTGVVGGSLYRFGVGASPFLLPLLLQVGFGLTALQSGLLTFASAVGAIAMKFVAPPVLRRFGFRRVLVLNALVAGLFVAAPALFSPAWGPAAILAVLLVGGFFRSLEFTALNAIVYADVSPQRMSHATTLASVAQQVAASVGISIGAAALTLAAGHSDALAAADFIPAFLIVGAITAAAALPFLRLAPDAGREVSGHGVARIGAVDPAGLARGPG